MGRSWQWLFGLLMLGSWVAPSSAWANPYDISLRGLGRPETATFSDPAVRRYRSLSTELVFAMAARPMAPAETLGMNGFEFSLVSTTSDISEKAPYWQGQPGAPVFEGVLPSHGGRKVPSSFWLPTAHFRKGFPLSTEIGITAAYLAFSEMVLTGVEGKIALHESYFRWAPAISLRGAVGRLFGSSDLDITTFEADVLTSLPFGVGGMIQITPYLGYGRLFAHVNSQVLDETPFEVMDSFDQKGGADGSLYTFPTLEWSNNASGRLFGGLRVTVAMIELLYELDVGFLDKIGKTLQSHSFKLGFDV